MKFKVYQTVVYPGFGVGTITSIQKKEIFGKPNSFYVVEIFDSGMKVMIPVDNTDHIGLRKTVSKEEALQIIDILKDKTVTLDNINWNTRYRESMEKIKTGKTLEIAGVLRDLLNLQKDLSFGERKMIDTAKSLLTRELSLVVPIGEFENILNGE